MVKYILFLVLLWIKVIYTLKQCDDCVLYTSCPNAMELAKRQVHGDIFKTAFCGYDISQPKSPPMVCCSDFAATAGNTGIESIGAQIGAPESDQVERTIPTAARVPIESHPNVRLLPDADCGDIDGKRVVGGTIAGLYEFPWMALIATRTRSGLDFSCGGSIINSRYILTAAHCIHNIAGVRVGDYDITSTTDCQGSGTEYICETHYQDIEVEEEIVHEGWSTSNPDKIHDIALLRLKEPVDFSHRNVAPICLPATEEMRIMSLDDKKVTVAGWGVTETGRDSKLLRKVDISIVRRDTCLTKYKSSGNPKIINENQVCAGKIRRDSCNGDSGSPMMLESEYRGSYRIVQYGLVSYGPTKCGSSVPGVYTNVAKYMDWILDHMRE
ncbi:phenoloxidase-activating factor 3-like [Aricia agestis]|uniref:phenoloxidase-activating factor 3-like n=1 Tax=Aricia agestis TaxID=91739 RepID=UPI001C203FF0|nr:phenoloxidase-activating factor 3-like [Aricia agestis]